MIPAGQLHILVIDDNQDILFMLRAMLQHRGYHVSIKEDTNELDSLIETTSPYVILMDMLLSGADGREICKHLKSIQKFSGIPVIMLSAHPQAKTECLAAGADFFLEKPFEMNDLFSVVDNAENKIKIN
jgi:DNA-binding response OmpR family regulator